MRSALVLGAALGSLHAAAALAQTYAVAINQPASTVTYAIALDAPFATTPALPQNGTIPAASSYLIGGAAATPPTTPATRTRPATCILCGSFTGNWPVAITAGGIDADITSGTTPLHPSGAFSLALNVAAGTCSIADTNLNLLGGATVPFTVGVSVGFQSFQTNSPTSTFVIPGATIPLNQDATVSSIIATQSAPGSGTISPTGTPGVFTFSAPVTLTLTITATLAGSAAPIPPQDVPVVISGMIDTNVAAAPLSASIDIDTMETIPGPTPLDPLPFPEPIYGGQLRAFIVLASQTVSIAADATISATATRQDEPDPVDFNGDGNVDADDLGDFINAYFAIPPDPRTDFNHDGSIDADDLGDYINAYFSR
ncbi:MAG: hypothetical protein AB7K52_00035 [Phycisphaerales bacterium]